MKSILRARRLIWIWSLASGSACLFIILGQKGMNLSDGITHPNVWIAALVGLVVSCLASPLLTAPWMRWYWSALLALPLGLLVVFGFFFIQPHSWQPSRWDAWKSVAMFVDICPLVILPASVLAGVVGSVLVCDDSDSVQTEE